MNTTTTNPTTTNPTEKPTSLARRRSTGSGSIWKSAIVAASLSGVLLGWAVLGRGEVSIEMATTVTPSSQAVIVNSNSQFSQRSVMPQKPVFQQPVTSTRRS